MRMHHENTLLQLHCGTVVLLRYAAYLLGQLWQCGTLAVLCVLARSYLCLRAGLSVVVVVHVVVVVVHVILA